MQKFSICLFFSDTGGGHRSAVDAVETALIDLLEREFNAKNFKIIAENIAEKSHPINRIFVDLYNYLLRHNQASMKYYHHFIHAFKPNSSEFGYQLCRSYLKKLITQHKPTIIVSLHPMINQYLERAIQEIDRNKRPKLLLVVTDPNGESWEGWATPNADLTIVPNILSRDQLVSWGVPAKKIRVIGMPVHPDFLKPAAISKEEFRFHLGLDPDRLTICLNAGWAGGGNMMDIYHQLVAVARDIQVVFLCGHNRKLYEQVKRVSRKIKIPTAVLPFHDRMADVMNAVDLMVTKAGGLTTFEAIAQHLPIAIDMITPPMPQELGTVKILVEQKLAVPIEQATDVISIVENFVCAPDRQSISLPSAYCLDRVDAVYKIAQTILSYCDPSFELPDENKKTYKPSYVLDQ